jgi:serine/threonine-protein kinase ATR
LDLNYFEGFEDEVEVMKSLAKPRRITIIASNGQRYMMMAKPKDDLRKDARLMDFNAIINKLLKKNSESRRRQLRKHPSTFTALCNLASNRRHPHL